VKENGSKIIEKVIVFYMDKTFEKYDNLIIWKCGSMIIVICRYLSLSH
jgi:hypothetical protein